MTTAQKHQTNGNFGITLDTGSKIIEPMFTEKLLGAHISNDFKWNEHIRDNYSCARQKIRGAVAVNFLFPLISTYFEGD